MHETLRVQPHHGKLRRLMVAYRDPSSCIEHKPQPAGASSTHNMHRCISSNTRPGSGHILILHREPRFPGATTPGSSNCAGVNLLLQTVPTIRTQPEQSQGKH